MKLALGRKLISRREQSRYNGLLAEHCDSIAPAATGWGGNSRRPVGQSWRDHGSATAGWIFYQRKKTSFLDNVKTFYVIVKLNVYICVIMFEIFSFAYVFREAWIKFY